MGYNHLENQRQQLQQRYEAFKENTLVEKNRGVQLSLHRGLSKEDILAIPATDLRQKAISENLHLFR